MTASVYLDHHATTPIDARVLEAMRPFLETEFGNAASTQHAYGQRAADAVDLARAQLAALLRAKPSEMVFTSGATESDNTAIKGVARGLRRRGQHLITQATEHRAVIDSCKSLEREGFQVTYLGVDADGRIDPDELSAAITEQTVLISVMLCNNEVGTTQDVAAISKIANEASIIFHCDAAQGLGYLPIDASMADLISISSHKMYGPKGIGGLYVSRRCQALGLPAPLIDGGGHEHGIRSGTLNVAGIVGLGEAAQIMRNEGNAEAERIAILRKRLHRTLASELDEVQLNGPEEGRHPGNLNLSFGYVEGAKLLLELCKEVAVSSGAACSSAHPGPSYVLAAMGVPKNLAAASIRYGVGRHTTEAQIDLAAKATIRVVNELRAKSQLWSARQLANRRPEP